jgi:hypothetical protein
MSADYDDTPGARPAPKHRGALACSAPGCPWAGSAGETGRFLCIAHQGHEANQWDGVTRRTIEMEWFATFIADVQRMVNFPRKGEPSWIAYAAQFWVNTDPTMQPVQAEMRSPGLYLYRMLGELRAMALGKDRPQPHVPQGDWPSFQAQQPQAAPAVAVAAKLPPALPKSPAPAPRRPELQQPVDEPPAWAMEDAGLCAADSTEFPAPNDVGVTA